MKKLFKRSSLAFLYACKLHVVGDVISVPLSWASGIKCAQVLVFLENGFQNNTSRALVV